MYFFNVFYVQIHVQIHVQLHVQFECEAAQKIHCLVLMCHVCLRIYYFLIYSFQIESQISDILFHLYDYLLG